MAGRYGGTYARTDIAFEFASWISVEFKLYLVKEFQRLKEEEQKLIGCVILKRIEWILTLTLLLCCNPRIDFRF